MKQHFVRLLFITAFFSAAFCNANTADAVHPNAYLYNEQGNPVFIKLRLSQDNSQKNAHRPHQVKDVISLQHSTTYADESGEYVLASLVNWSWVCPFCGRTNPDYNEYCGNSNCPLSAPNCK